MRESFERYYANIKEANDLVRPKISSGLPRDELLEVIHANAERLTKLKYENDEFLRDNILTADPRTLTADDIAELSELADILFHNATGCDIGIAYKIHSLIYKYAEYYGKRDLMIKELYYQGLTLYYLHFSIGSMKINTNGKELYDYYCRGASYINQYEDIEDEDTRGYIIRCLGNRKYGHPAITIGLSATAMFMQDTRSIPEFSGRLWLLSAPNVTAVLTQGFRGAIMNMLCILTERRIFQAFG